MIICMGNENLQLKVSQTIGSNPEETYSSSTSQSLKGDSQIKALCSQC